MAYGGADKLRFTILGCGSSGGVPRLGAEGKTPNWGDCDPDEPRNYRKRCSLLVERVGRDGVTRVLIDTTPDLRDQLLAARVGVLDAVVYTHAHADHTHGIDDLRQVVFNLGMRLPVWADEATKQALLARFGYVFEQPSSSSYPPILEMNTIRGPLRVRGAGGDIALAPFACGHGHMDALGFRIGNLAYLPDAVTIPEVHWPKLRSLDMWIVDALQRKPHPSHAHLEMTLGWIARAQPQRAILTNLHIDMDFATLTAELPAHIRPAYDGMAVELPCL